MAETRFIYIRGKAGHCVPMIDADGFTLLGRPHRWAGLDVDGVTPRVERVADDSYWEYHRQHGAIEVVTKADYDAHVSAKQAAENSGSAA